MRRPYAHPAVLRTEEPDPNAGATGTVTHQWTMGDMFTAAQLGKVGRSISHVWWQTTPLRLDGGRVIVDASGRAFAVDPGRGTLARP